MSDDWGRMSACDLGREIEDGQIDPVALTEFFLDAVRGHAFRETIYARMTEDRARAEAKAARQRAQNGTRASLLDGVPISWKDLFDTANVATEAGSRLLAGRVPRLDAKIVANAAAAGVVSLGKTHLTELAFSGLGLNPSTETPPNINNPALVPGGSSSGAAASTAFGLAAAGIGSDTGGSVRIPAAWNNLVGMKTTHGLVSLEGVVPLCARFDTVGPLCRTVEDATHLIGAMTANRPVDLKAARLQGKRFLVLETLALDECDDPVMQGFDDAVARLEAGGAHIVRAPLETVNDALDLAGCLYTVEAYGTWGERIEADPEAMYGPIRERFRAGREFSGADYVRAWQELDRLRVEYATATAAFDGVLCPTSPILPPDRDRLLADDDYFREKNILGLRNTRIGNLLGLCALTLPTSQWGAGLMVMGAAGADAALLRIGAAIEAQLLQI